MALNNTQPVKQDNCIQNGDPHVSEMLNIKVLEILVYATVSSSKLNLESPEQCGVAKTQKKKKVKHTQKTQSFLPAQSLIERTFAQKDAVWELITTVKGLRI